MANNNYRLLVIDIDGTLLGASKIVSAENREALAEVRRQGVRVSLSTGRSLKSSLHILEQLSLDGYHIFFDGALVSRADLGEEVFLQPIDKDIVRQMIRFAGEHGIDLELFSTMNYFAERETWSTRARKEFFGNEANILDFTDLWEREVIIKGGLVTMTPQEEALAERFQRHFGELLGFSQAMTPAYPGIVFNNVLATGVSKGRALEVLAAHLGMATGEVMAVGDGSNDVSLLSSAGLAIAMGNAPEEVKAVADHVTLDVDQNGLAAALNRFIL